MCFQQHFVPLPLPDAVDTAATAKTSPHNIMLNNLHVAGESRRQFKNVTKLSKMSTSWQYSESPWEIHSNKYKHARYWFSNSWNSRWNFRNVRKQTDFCSVKPGLRSTVSVNQRPNISTIVVLCMSCRFEQRLVRSTAHMKWTDEGNSSWYRLVDPTSYPVWKFMVGIATKASPKRWLPLNIINHLQIKAI